MSTSPHVNDVFDAFVAAKQAIDKVPDLEAQIKALQDQLSTANQMVDLYAQDQINFKNELDTHKNKLSAAEASLETHRKSNSDLQARFDLVLGTLRDITSGIGTTLGVVEPPEARGASWPLHRGRKQERRSRCWPKCGAGAPREPYCPRWISQYLSVDSYRCRSLLVTDAHGTG